MVLIFYMEDNTAFVENAPFEGLFYCLIVLCILMSYMIGANDAANSLGTSYGSKALSLKKAVITFQINSYPLNPFSS